MALNARIKAAITDLHNQVKLNIAVTAKKYEIARKTLSDRFHSKSTCHDQSLRGGRRRHRRTRAGKEGMASAWCLYHVTSGKGNNCNNALLQLEHYNIHDYLYRTRPSIDSEDPLSLPSLTS
jgi:hypothetical protein